MADQEVRQLVENGIAALKSGETTEARRLLASAIQRDPRNERAWLYLATLLPRPQAKDALEKVLAINPNNEQARKGLESFKSAAPSAPTITANPPRPRAVPPTTRPVRPGANIEELPMSGSDAPSRYTPPGGLHESMRLQKVETRPPMMQPVFIEPGYQPLEVTDNPEVGVEQYEEANRLLQNIDTQSGEYSIELRDMLLAPYDEKPRRSPWGLILGLLLLLILVGGGIGAYFWLNQPTNEATPTPQVVVSASTVEAAVTTVSVSNLNAPTNTPQPTATLAPTLAPSPTPTPTLRLNVAPGERAVLRGYAVTLSQYENRSTNFSFGGAGTPKANFHFEGVLVKLESIYPQTLPIKYDNFQAVDGRNGFSKPVGGGRVPSLDILRLLPGEIRTAWLTFEVEDGTTLRKVIFAPTTQLDQNNSVDINLTLPTVTPTPTSAPRPTVTATPRPTNTPTVAPTATPKPTATPVPPTATPQPTFTPVVVGSPGVFVPPADVPATATLAPTNTPVPEPTATATAVPTNTPVPPTPQPTATVGPTATPLPLRVTPGPQGELGKRLTLGNSFALTVTNYVVSPTIKPPPLVMPTGYHYETVRLSLDLLSNKEVADYLSSFPFYIRDEDGNLYSVGPLTLELKDAFNPRTFAATATAAGKTRASGLLYFLVSDAARNKKKSFIFYASPDLNSERIEIPLRVTP